jgi:hypothetical protein
MISDWREEFVYLLSSPEPEDWEKARALKLAHLPPSLYRFRPANDHSLKALERGTVWLSNASKFNDLYDTSVVVDVVRGITALFPQVASRAAAGLPAEILSRLLHADDVVAVLDRVFASEIEKTDGPDAAKKAKDFFRNFLATYSRDMTARMTTAIQHGTKVACFCEVNDSPMLWGYYTNSEGFCIEYHFADLPADDLRIRWLLPVLYSPKGFSLTSFGERLNGKPNPFVAMLAAIHKSAEWAHEREWRIVYPSGEDSPGKEIVMPQPAQLFLGCRMDPDYRKKVVEIARARSIPLMEMTPAGDSFKLHATPLAVTP